MRLTWQIGVAGLFGVSVWLAAGCTPLSRSLLEPPPPVVRGAQPETLPPPREVGPTRPMAGDPKSHIVPISLDVVFQLANDQNGQINLARAKVNEAFAARELADKRWLPDLYVGPAYYRHEGGSQDFNGDLIHSSHGSLFAGVELRGKIDLRDLVFAKVDAERKVWQQNAELSKLTSENLLDAANTYIDLLAARSGEAISREFEKKLNDVLVVAKKRADAVPKAIEEVHRTKSGLAAQRQIHVKLRESSKAAAARLIYLLGLDPSSELMVLERKFAPFDLVDARVPAAALVDQALRRGPGIRELEGLLGVIEEARAKASGAGRLLPTFELTVAEGAFGAGPGSNMNWDNRLDIAVQARWNLTDLLTARERRWLAQTKMQQAQLTYDDVRAKLTMGVHEAREAVLSAAEQIHFGETRVQEARSAYETSYKFLEGFKGELGNVLTAIEALAAAEYDYIRAIRAYDQAQIRLFILTGLADPAHHGYVGLPVPHHNGRSVTAGTPGTPVVRPAPR